MQETSVAYELLKGAYAEWQKLPRPSHCWQQDNIHGVAWESGPHTLRLVVNVSTLREHSLAAGLQLWRDGVSWRDVDVNLCALDAPLIVYLFNELAAQDGQ